MWSAASDAGVTIGNTLDSFGADMSEIPPILVTFDGAVWRPKDDRTLARALQYFEAGETYRVEFKDQRSAESHNATMAGIARAWDNLPDGIEKRYPTIRRQSPKHFRKWLLIVNGFCDTRDIVFDSEDDAKRAATIAREGDGYAVILVRHNVVTIHTAQSMATKAMGKAMFETAKQLILAQAAEMIGMTVAELTSRPEPVDHSHPYAPPELDQPATVLAPADTPAAAPPSPGPSTPQPQERPEATETPSRGEPPQPKTPDQYFYWIRAWLGFTTDRRRIEDRFLHEQETVWPTLNPRLSPDDREMCRALVEDRLRELPVKTLWR